MKTSFIKSNVSVKLDISKYDKKFKKAQERLINQIRIDSEKYVPADTLVLSNSAHPENNNTELVYSTPYARFQYFGKVMVDDRGSTWARKGTKKHVIDRDLVYSKERHPDATSKWYEAAENNYKDEWVKLVKEVVKNG